MTTSYTAWSSSQPGGYRRSNNPRVVFPEWDRIEDTHPKLYFAYGSNLDILQMQQRCSTAFPASPIDLLDYKLVFSGVATVEPSQGSFVPGALYHVKTVDILCLDAYEGYPNLYDKEFGKITSGELEGQEFFFYTLTPPYQVSMPSEMYYCTLMDGYKDWDLPKAALRRARKQAKKADKHNKPAGKYGFGWADDDYDEIVVTHKHDGLADDYLLPSSSNLERCEVCGMLTPLDEIDVVYDEDYAYVACDSCRELWPELEQAYGRDPWERPFLGETPLDDSYESGSEYLWNDDRRPSDDNNYWIWDKEEGDWQIRNRYVG